MYSYFTLPYNLFKEENIKAYDNTTFCQNQNEEQSPKTKLVVGERTYKLPTFTEEELKTEVWKQIKDFPNYYISNLGRIYSGFTNKIRKPKLSPLDKRKNNPVSITLCYDKEDSNGNVIRSVATKTFVSLMKEYFPIERGLNCYRNIDVYVIYKDNNPFNCRLTNLLLTSNQNLIRYVKECNKKNFQTEEDIENKTIFLIRDDYVNDFLQRINKGDIKKKFNINCKIELLEENFVILSCDNCGLIMVKLLDYCKNSQSKQFLMFSFRVKVNCSNIDKDYLNSYIQHCRDYFNSQNNNNKNNS